MGTGARHDEDRPARRFLRFVRLSLVGLVGVALGPAACDLSSVTGQSGQVSYSAQNCGATSVLSACDLKMPLVQGGAVDVTATLQKDGTLVAALSTDNPQVLGLTANGGAWTVLGLSPGPADLLATYDPQKAPDMLALTVQPIGSFAFVTGPSAQSGTYLQAEAVDSDGTFSLLPGVSTFSLYYAQQTAQGNPMIGRQGFGFDLGGLSLQGASPAGLQFDLITPAPGSYILTVTAKAGGARIRTKVIVPAH